MGDNQSTGGRDTAWKSSQITSPSTDYVNGQFYDKGKTYWNFGIQFTCERIEDCRPQGGEIMYHVRTISGVRNKLTALELATESICMEKLLNAGAPTYVRRLASTDAVTEKPELPPAESSGLGYVLALILLTLLYVG